MVSWWLPESGRWPWAAIIGVASRCAFYLSMTHHLFSFNFALKLILFFFYLQPGRLQAQQAISPATGAKALAPSCGCLPLALTPHPPVDRGLCQRWPGLGPGLPGRLGLAVGWRAIHKVLSGRQRGALADVVPRPRRRFGAR